MMEKAKAFWIENFSYIIPSVCVVGYLILLILLHFEIISISLIQDSECFVNLLESFVTFMSIVLSVFGFLIPSMISAKEKSDTMNYFFRYVDMRLFAKRLKNIVANGLVIIFITCILFLSDIFSTEICNTIILVWIWLVFYFMCCSYRYISVIINILLVEKKKFIQEVVNEVSEEEKQILNEKLPRI